MATPTPGHCTRVLRAWVTFQVSCNTYLLYPGTWAVHLSLRTVHARPSPPVEPPCHSGSRHRAFISARTQQLSSATETTGRHTRWSTSIHGLGLHNLSIPALLFRTLFHIAIGAPLLSCFSSFNPPPLRPALPCPAWSWKEDPPRLCPGILKLDSRRERDTARQKAVRHRSDLPISPALSVISTASPGANPSTLPARQPIHPIHRRLGPLVPWSPGLSGSPALP